MLRAVMKKHASRSIAPSASGCCCLRPPYIPACFKPDFGFSRRATL
jgi:hypothetical protein